MICGKIVARQAEISLVGEREDGYLAECVLPAYHRGHCVFNAPEGKYVAWEREDCECCHPGDADGCYIYWEISQEKFNEIVAQVAESGR